MKMLHACVLALMTLSLIGTTLAKPPEDKGKPAKSSQAGSSASDHSSQHSGGAAPQEPGAGHGRQWEDRNGDGRVDLDVSYLQGFIRENHYNSGYESLPPGIRKNLARGKPIPPGLQSRVVPGPLLQQLPYRAGYEWRVYGTDLVLVALATGVVEEVLDEIFD